MNIREYISYTCGIAFVLLTLFSCREDMLEPGVQEGEAVVRLSGTLRLADSATPPTIYLRGMKKEEDGTYNAYFNTTAFKPVTLGETPSAMELTDARYYPLSDSGQDNYIYLFAFTNTVDANMNMSLRAGYDELLANNGRSVNEESTNAEGVKGSSNDPVEVLNFRHVMTQVNVKVEIDIDGEEEELGGSLESIPEAIAFTVTDVYNSGSYKLTAKEPQEGDPNPDKATAVGTTLYTLTEGTHYLVPTGQNLTGRSLKSLKIDDYTAPNADLNTFKIQKEDDSDFILLPGYAYNLTLKIRRLQVEVYAGQTTWTGFELGNDDVTAESKILEMNLGAYNTDINNYPDPITKVVLYGEDGKMYVGEPNQNGDMAFVTLPAGTVKEVELYTGRGLLVRRELNTTLYNGTTYVLDFPLSVAGMFLEIPSGQNSEANPYLVQTVTQFIKIWRDADGLCYKQMENLEFDSFIMDDLNQDMGEFSGIYDGNGFSISKSVSSGSGIFGVNKGIIKNMRITSGTLNANDWDEYAGIICRENQGQIIGCINEARITMSEGAVGGICGLNGTNGRIIGCLNIGNIEAGTVKGGICGENRNTSQNAIIGCVNTGRVVYHYLSTDIIGGICGKTVEGSGANTISNCYWLYGTAAFELGGKEYAVGNLPAVTWNDVTAVSVDWLIDDNKGCAKLNTVSSSVQFQRDPVNGGTIWPLPKAN